MKYVLSEHTRIIPYEFNYNMMRLLRTHSFSEVGQIYLTKHFVPVVGLGFSLFVVCLH